MPTGLAVKTLELIAAARIVLREIQPATVRGVCYRLFTQGVISDMSKRETGKVSRALTIARERWLVPWDWVVDESRTVERRPAWSDPSAYMQSVQHRYRRDRWQDQPERVLVLSEKGTVGGLLRPVLRRYGVGFLVLHGFGSATSLNDLAEFSRNDDRPLTLLYVGDHDPSGRFMSDIDIPKRLAQYGGLAALVRLAVTPDQIAMYDLPTFPSHTKSKDARYRWFVENHGETCCELDALSPNVLRDKVEAAIVARIDRERWDRADTVEAVEMESLRDFLSTWPATT